MYILKQYAIFYLKLESPFFFLSFAMFNMAKVWKMNIAPLTVVDWIAMIFLESIC